MPDLILNGVIIEDVVPEGEGTITISDVDMLPIIKSRYGHAVFDYVGGVVILNQARHDAFLLNDNKSIYINELIKREKVLMAKERLALPIQAIKNAANQNALDALKGN